MCTVNTGQTNPEVHVNLWIFSALFWIFLDHLFFTVTGWLATYDKGVSSSVCSLS